jgi:hypothetical protein
VTRPVLEQGTSLIQVRRAVKRNKALSKVAIVVCFVHEIAVLVYDKQLSSGIYFYPTIIGSFNRTCIFKFPYFFQVD